MTEQLLPCPFCGETYITIEGFHFYGLTYPAAICRSCYSRGAQSNSDEEAVEKWNRRPEPPWIDFRERRPADGQEVLFTWSFDRHGESWECFICSIPAAEDERYLCRSNDPEITFIFWQPLPAPPSAEAVQRAKEGKS